MARQINDYPLIIDTDKGDILSSFRSAVTIPAKSVVQGDTLRLLVRAVRPHPQAQAAVTQLWQDVPLPNQVYVGIGVIGREPTSGTFTLTFGANTTSAIAYNASAATVQTALNALASITSAGGVTVTGVAGGPWQVVFTTAGARAALSANVDALYPISQATIYTARDGTSELAEIQVISLECQPAALASSFSDFPAAAVTITELQTGSAGVPTVQLIQINDDAYGGAFTLAFSGAATGAIPYDSSAEDMQAFLEALTSIDAGNVSVTGQSPEWTVTFRGDLIGDQPLITGNAAGLNVPVGKIGLLSLDTAGMEQLLNGEASVDAYLEVQCMYGGTAPATILREQITVYNDLLANSPGAPLQLPGYLTASASDDRYTRYDAAQTLTSGQQDQAVANLGLASRFLTAVPDNTVTAAKLTTDAVTTAKLASASVTTAKIADANVTADKLASNAVTTAKMTDANVTTAKIADANVTAAKLASDSVTTTKIADGAVTAAKLEAVSGLTAATVLVKSVTVDAKGRITGYKPKYRASITANATKSALTTDLDVTTLTIPAGTLELGDVIEFEMFGTTNNSTTASNFLTWIKINGTKTTAVTHAMGTAAASAVGWHMRGLIRVDNLTNGSNLTCSFATQWKLTQGFSNANTATVNLSTTALTITPGLNFSVATGAAATVYTAAAWMQ